MKRCRFYAALAIIIYLIASGARTPGQSQSTPQGAPQQPLVKLNVIVLDKKQQPVADLRQEDFQVFEGDVPQTISFFSKEDVPVSYGLLIDSSGSLRTQFRQVMETAYSIINANRSIDEMFLVSFISSDRIMMMQDFTSDKVLLINSLNNIQIEGGQTAVLDALYVAAERIGKHRMAGASADRRFALLLVSDGEDRNSVHPIEDVMKLLRRENVQVFSIGLVNELDKEGGFIRRSARDKAVKLLEDVAKETGGIAFFPRKRSDIQTIAEQITKLLRTQYVIGFNPTGVKISKDSYRKVRVKLVEKPSGDKLTLITQPGYNVPGKNTGQSK